MTDIHGATAQLRAVFDQIQTQAVDQVVCLGDIFECRIGKREVAGYEYGGRLTDVFDPDPELAGLLDGARLVRGNQEERIRALVPDPDLPAWTRPLLDAPLERRTDFALYCHGHPLPWRELEPGLWCPADADFPGRALVHGHHHRSALYRLWPGGTGRPVRVERLPVRFGEPVPLAADGRYVVNVGSVTGCDADRGPSPAWAVVDEAAATVTYHHTPQPTAP
ncbi:metallophosphoesterase family protein [Streptomyces sp. HNM0663]|uniref:Metallophosphoesterase family protein n=1 Tax=Streptomyces chengmaiensis TaxID=3040919 RepID=A0ABT6HJL6_9ACTN|nr:metallophosphoesterase family protein [Streptomyces chengmaiensis]MDH2388931.1 metallophosphoesterase family protein [Streptomyces chengmaiensis]